jgi:hypothetical protein
MNVLVWSTRFIGETLAVVVRARCWIAESKSDTFLFPINPHSEKNPQLGSLSTNSLALISERAALVPGAQLCHPFTT